MRILCLVDFQVGASKWLWEYSPTHDDQIEFLDARTNRRILRYSKSLAYALAFGRQAFQAIQRVSKYRYDLVVAWESKNGFLYGVLRRLLRRYDHRFVILAFGLRGPLLRFIPLARYALQATNAITVPSSGERDLYVKRLALPSGRVHVCPNGMYDLTRAFGVAGELEPLDRDTFIFAGGYSHRDFDVLIAAAEGTDVPVRIIAPRHGPLASRLPSNVKWCEPLPGKDYYQQMRAARVVVIPLKDVPFAVGLVELLSAMALGKAIIVTRTIATPDYVQSNENAILVPPGDYIALRQAIEYLLEHPAAREQMGKEARARFCRRYRYDAFAMRVHQFLREVSATSVKSGS